ncbi:MAG: nitroreductase family protein [Candidatus Methanomethylicia archaeon]
MDLFKAIYERTSIRSFKSSPIPEEDLMKILDYAIQAPSAGNLQPWEFVIVKNEETKRKLVDAAYGQDFISGAPIVVVVCANKRISSSRYGDRGENLYCIQDTAAATYGLILAAYALGYGACWIGAFSERKVSQILNIPEHVRPVAIIPIGIPAEKPLKPERIPLSRKIHLEKY